MLASNDRHYVFVAMHRGDWRNYPENSRDAANGDNLAVNFISVNPYLPAE